MHFIGSEACRDVDRVIVGVLNVREVYIRVILVFVAYHGQHLHYGVVLRVRRPRYH